MQPYTPEQLACWGRMFQARHDWLAQRGIPYVVLIAPDKQTVYPEHLPHSLKRRTESNSHLDQLLAYLRAHTTVQVLDVRAAMHEAKARERLYDYTDSHWNGRGAYVAYDGLIEALSPQFPGMRPVPRSDFDNAVGVAPGGDCARLLGLRDHLA